MFLYKVTLPQQLKGIILEVTHDTGAHMATDVLQVGCMPSNKAELIKPTIMLHRFLA
jgi:hypothetical protein